MQLQIELYDNNQETIAFLEPHCAFFTFGENYGNADCGLPVSDRFDFKPTRQPVVMDFWEDARRDGGGERVHDDRQLAAAVAARCVFNGRGLPLEQAPRVPEVPRPARRGPASRSSWR